jgi:hypothetical protein
MAASRFTQPANNSNKAHQMNSNGDTWQLIVNEWQMQQKAFGLAF